MSGPGTQMTSEGALRDRRTSILAGTVVAVLVGALGAFLTLTSSSLWTAQASVIVLPASGMAAGEETAYYEYLSRGQIIATFAEVGNNAQFVEEAQTKAGMNDADRAQSQVTLSVVPSTSVVVATATAPTADQAVALANATLELASTYLEGLAVPFRAEVVAGAAPATSAGPSKALMAFATLVAALVAGVAIQQLVQVILRSRGRRDDIVPRSPTSEPAQAPSAER